MSDVQQADAQAIPGSDIPRELPRELLYQITWSGSDVTRDISRWAERVVFTDYLHGKSDNIEITFSDDDDRWKDERYPLKGDTISLRLGTSRIGFVNAGTFEIDEIESAGPPDVMVVRGIATNITRSLRETKTRNWEDAGLARIVSDIARDHGLGTRYLLLPEGLRDLRIDRVDQNEQPDLEFLRELADTYGCVTKVDRGELVFADPVIMSEQVESITLIRGRAGLKRHQFVSRAHNIYKAVEVQYFLPHSRILITHREEDESVRNGDVYRITERAGGIRQAREIARRRLRVLNRREQTGELDLVGWHGWISGARIELSGYGVFDGPYMIEETEHNMSRGEGYTTRVKVVRWSR